MLLSLLAYVCGLNSNSEVKKSREHMKITFEKHVAQSLTTTELSSEIWNQSPNFEYQAFLPLQCLFGEVILKSLGWD